MTLLVRAFGAYRADISTGWRQQDFLVRNLVKSLKGEPFNGYSLFTIGGKPYRIAADDDAAAYELWTNWAGGSLRDQLKLGRVTLVPVPSSTQIRFGQNTPPVRMASSIATRWPKLASVGNFVRHKTKQQGAHSGGGTRNPDQIEQSLVCNVTDKSMPVVLVDDVMSTGGHLTAAARVLRLQGVTVEHALVAGRTVWEAVANPYKVTPEDIEAIPDFDELPEIPF